MKFILILLLLVGCGPRSMEEFRRDGRESTQGLIRTLQLVRSPRDFPRVQNKLKAEFLDLAEVMIAAREHWLSYSQEDVPELTEEDRALSARLKQEIVRIQKMKEGAAFISACQLEANSKLNLFEQRVKRKLSVG